MVGFIGIASYERRENQEMIKRAAGGEGRCTNEGLGVAQSTRGTFG